MYNKFYQLLIRFCPLGVYKFVDVVSANCCKAIQNWPITRGHQDRKTKQRIVLKGTTHYILLIFLCEIRMNVCSRLTSWLSGTQAHTVSVFRVTGLLVTSVHPRHFILFHPNPKETSLQTTNWKEPKKNAKKLEK